MSTIDNFGNADDSVLDDSYLNLFSKPVTDEAAADVEVHGYIPVNEDSATPDPFTSKGGIAYALDSLLDDELSGEVEGTKDEIATPVTVSKETPNGNCDVSVKDSLSEALGGTFAMDDGGLTSTQEDAYEAAHEKWQDEEMKKAVPKVPKSLGGGDDTPDDNGLVYITRTFTVDPRKYISTNYRPSQEAGTIKKPLTPPKAMKSPVDDMFVRKGRLEEEAADEGGLGPQAAAEQGEAGANGGMEAVGGEAKGGVIPDNGEAAGKPTADEAVVLDYASAIDGTSFLCYDEVAGIDYAKVAMDAGPKTPVTRANCKTTFAQCRAKNPLYCRFHGPKLLEADIRKALVNTLGKMGGCTVAVTKDNGAKNPMTFRLTVGCVPQLKKKMEDTIDKLMHNLPGITMEGHYTDLGEGKETIEFKMDIVKADQPPKKSDWDLQALADTKKAAALGKKQKVVGPTPPKIEKMAKKGGVAEEAAEGEETGGLQSGGAEPPQEAGSEGAEEAPISDIPNGSDVPKGGEGGNENESVETAPVAEPKAEPLDGGEETSQEGGVNEASEGGIVKGGTENTVAPEAANGGQETSGGGGSEDGEIKEMEDLWQGIGEKAPFWTSELAIHSLGAKDAIHDAYKAKVVLGEVNEFLGSLGTAEDSGLGEPIWATKKSLLEKAKAKAEGAYAEEKAKAKAKLAEYEAAIDKAYADYIDENKAAAAATVESIVKNLAKLVFPHGKPDGVDSVKEMAMEMAEAVEAKATAKKGAMGGSEEEKQKVLDDLMKKYKMEALRQSITQDAENFEAKLGSFKAAIDAAKDKEGVQGMQAKVEEVKAAAKSLLDTFGKFKRGLSGLEKDVEAIDAINDYKAAIGGAPQGGAPQGGGGGEAESMKKEFAKVERALGRLNKSASLYKKFFDAAIEGGSLESAKAHLDAMKGFLATSKKSIEGEKIQKEFDALEEELGKQNKTAGLQKKIFDAAMAEGDLGKAKEILDGLKKWAYGDAGGRSQGGTEKPKPSKEGMKAKVAKMPLKEKLEKAIAILEGKMAKEPDNEEWKSKYEQFKAAYEKLG